MIINQELIRVIRIILTAIYAIFAGIGIVNIFFKENATIITILLVILYVCTGMALNNRGGKKTRYVAIFTGGIFCLGFIAAGYVIISPLLGEAFDTTLAIVSCVFGLLGTTTILLLRKDKALLRNKDN